MVSQTTAMGGMAFGPMVAAVSPGASPYIWQNSENVPVQMFISVGTVTTIEYSPDGVSYVNCGILAGCLIVNPRQYVRVTYVIAPTMNYCPI
jgi:hypothetical protein